MVDRRAPVRSVWLTVQLFLQPQTHRMVGGSEVRGSGADKLRPWEPRCRVACEHFKGRGSTSANAFLAALLRLWSVETGAELYMVIRSRRRAPATPASCMFTFSPTPKIVAKIVAGKKEKKKSKKCSFVALTQFSFLRKGREYELQPGERRKALCKAVSH